MNQNSVLEQILHLSCRMAETRDLQPLLIYAVDVALDLFNAEHGYLILCNSDDSLDFRVKRKHGGSEITVPEISRQILDCVLSEGQPIAAADALEDPAFDTSPSVHALHIRSVMCVPLMAHNDTIGALYLDNRLEQNAFTSSDLKFLQLFANQAAVSIENAILNEHALVEIKTLRGIIPICSHCKNIRDDEGYWQQVEIYVRDHSEAEFSHSICPDCMQKHYPDVYNKIDRGKQDILDALATLEHANLKDIARAIGLPDSNIWSRLRIMVEDGRVKQMDVDGQKFYKLA